MTQAPQDPTPDAPEGAEPPEDWCCQDGDKAGFGDEAEAAKYADAADDEEAGEIG